MITSLCISKLVFIFYTAKKEKQKNIKTNKTTKVE